MGSILLFLGSMIWGASFVAQAVGMEYVEPFTFQAIRCLMGSAVLVPVILFRDKKMPDKNRPVTAADKKTLWQAGLSCGLVLFVAVTLQQLGLLYTTAGKSGFVTALYIILVPILGLFLRKKVKPWVWGSVVLAIVGLYLLCVSETMSIGTGEWLTLCCSLFFSIQILLIDHFSPRVDGVRLSCLQFLISGLISIVPMVLWETPNWDAIVRCWLPLCYSGILSSGVAYTFQIVGQAHTEPTVASLLMSLESVFSVLFGWILLGQALRPKELFGCVLVFSGVILAQLPEKRTEAHHDR